MEHHASFATLLRRHRLAAGLTQDALAERARLSARTVSDLERGVSLRPRLDSLILLSDSLALSPTDRSQFEEAARHVVPAHDTPAQQPPPPRTNLPRALSSFIARPRDQAAVTQLLATAPLVTLTGVGGCGKTRLALEVAAEVLARYPDGAWLVDLARWPTPRSFPRPSPPRWGWSRSPATRCSPP